MRAQRSFSFSLVDQKKREKSGIKGSHRLQRLPLMPDFLMLKMFEGKKRKKGLLMRYGTRYYIIIVNYMCKFTDLVGWYHFLLDKALRYHDG